MESYGSLPVGKRTRHMEAEMFRKLHKEIKRKRNSQGDGKIASLETRSEEASLGNEGNMGKNVSRGEKGELASKVKSKKAGVDQYGVRRRSNVLDRSKEKNASARREQSSFFKNAERKKSHGVNGNGGAARRTRSHSRLQFNDSENDFEFVEERDAGDSDTDTRETIVIGDDEDGEKEAGNGASSEQRFSRVSGFGGVASRTRSRWWLQFNYTENNMVYQEERKEGEGQAESSDYIHIGNDENGNGDEVEERDEACSKANDDDKKEDSDSAVNGIEESNSDEEAEREVGDRDTDKREIIIISDDEDGERDNGDDANREQRPGGVSGVGGVARRTRSRCTVVYQEERKDGKDAERNELIDVGDGENGNDEKVEELNAEEEEHEKDEAYSKDNNDDMEEDGDYAVNEGEAERKEGEGDAERNELIDIGDDENGYEEEVEDLNVKEEEAEDNDDDDCSNEDDDDMNEDSDYNINGAEEGNHDDEEVDNVVVCDGSAVDMDEPQTSLSSVDGSFKSCKYGGERNSANSYVIGQDSDVEKLEDEEEESHTLGNKPTLPLKFTFGDEGPPSRCKELEEDEDILQLWDELALSLGQNDVNDNQMEENKPETHNDIGDTAFCSKGNHQFVLDEEIGVICQRCSYVRLEIRYYVPPMAEELKVGGEEEDEKKDEACSDNNNDMEDSDYIFKSCKDGGEQNAANTYVVSQDSNVEELEDEEEENQTLGNKPVDPMDTNRCKFVKSNGKKPDFVAMRTRSHSSLASCMQKVSDGSMESSAGEGDSGPGMCQANDDTVKSLIGGKSDDVGNQKVKHGTIRNPRKRKHRYDPLKDHEVEKILVASILKDGNEDHPYEEITKFPSEPTLPQKFTYGVEEPPKHDTELEEDEDILQLWDELALSLSQIDVNDDQMEEKEETCNNVKDTAFCSQGDHQFFLDEEIGIVCQRCSYVRVEIKYCSPPMSKYPWGRSERREYLRSLNKIPDDFRYEDFEFNSESGLSPSLDLQGTVWSLVPGVRRGMHAHQVEGFEFLWENIAGGTKLDDLKEPVTSQNGSGCVISHAPGTGKTRLTIAFLQTYMKLYPSCKPVIIAPTSMLQTWESEFSKWQVEVPFLNLNDPKLVGNECKGVLKLLEPGNHSLHLIRLIKLFSWKRDGGVLALSYKLFVELTSRRPTEHGSAWKSLLDLPGLLILDEGHTPRNNCSIMWKALSKIKTWRKIILSGTPFQNNFDELFNIFCLIRPKFADKRTSGPSSARGWESKARAKWASLTSQIEQSGGDDRLNEARIDRVWREIAPFVHVHKGSILQRKLPGLKDSLVLLEPLEMQKDLLKTIDEALTDRSFNWEQAVTLACVHPSLLRSKLHIPSLVDVVDSRMLDSVQSDPEAGAKTKFVMELIRLCDLIGEKVLVFSQFIPPLNMIIKLLEAEMHWREGTEILVIQGQTETDRRQSSIRDFNDPRSESKIMLASTKACSEGISLVGASRVVLLDVGWNPSAERQAICRAYRLGQEKVVHVYHLLASGTNEEEKYGRQAAKYRCSELLFQSADPSDHDGKMPPTYSDVVDKVLEQMVEGDKLKHIINKVISIERF